MNRHDSTAAWAAIVIAATLHLLAAVGGIHAAATGHASIVTAALLAGPSIVALTAAGLCKVASRPMPAPTH